MELINTTNRTDRSAERIRDEGIHLGTGMGPEQDGSDKVEQYLIGSYVYVIDTARIGKPECYRIIWCELASEDDIKSLI